jgi:16S rRNA (cytosine1402-N4)-methyltransferase
MNTEKKAIHTTVLLQEIKDGLNLKEGSVLLDATLNNAGHSLFIANSLQNNITVLGIDEDSDALSRAESNLKKHKIKNFLYEGNFRNLDQAMDKYSIQSIDGAVFDLGLSSEQLEVSNRGFAFKNDEPLLMTFSRDPLKKTITAHDVVNSFSEENLEAIIKGFGEESFSRRIAKAIVEKRGFGPIQTTGVLREIIYQAVPVWYRRRKIHPATKTFQAIRMAVNDEVGALKEGLNKAFERLSSGGRIAVISFHSIEDREVKNLFRLWSKEGLGKLITKKPIVPTSLEIKNNPRSRSAKLRIIEKI